MTSVQNEAYVAGALVLAYTLQKHNPDLVSSTDLILVVPADNDLTARSKERLEQVGWKLHHEEKVRIKGVPRHWSNHVKLRIWRWTQYKKLVWLDADCMVKGDISLLLSERYGII